MKPDDVLTAVDALYALIVRGGEDTRRLRDVLHAASPDEAVLVSLLRRAVPVRFLELVGTTKPWCERAAVVAQVVLHPRSPRGLSLRLLPQLYWRQLADVARTPHVPAAVRVRAEASLQDQLRDLRLGEKVALARVATPPLIQRLLVEGDPKVLQALLQNPRLKEDDLLVSLRQADVSMALVDAVVASSRWGERYFVRLELALQPKTPLGVAMLQLSSLVKRDLERVARARGLRPLVQVAAERLLALDESPEGSET